MVVLGKRKITAIIMSALVLVSFYSIAAVQASETPSPIVYQGTGNDIIELTNVGDTNSYLVKENDSLWKIAAEKIGDGSRYMELVEANSDIITNPDLIYPGTVLQIPAGNVYLKGRKPKNYTGDYNFSYPSNWTVGYLGIKETSANYTLMGDGIEYIACLIQDKDSTLTKSTSDWEVFCQSIRDYAESEYKDKVSGLDFKHYQTEEKEEIYLCSYAYKVNLREYGQTGSYTANVCLGIRLTEHIQAQFLGLSSSPDIQGQVLYAAGSFTEFNKPTRPLSETSNMAILPVYSWDVSGMFNPFAWVAQFYDELMKDVFDIPEEKTLSEKFLERSSNKR